MNVRQARLSDFRQILLVDQLAHAERARKAWLKQAIRERCVWVLSIGRVLKAYGILRRSFFQRPFIEMLYVAKDERARGYGERLLIALERVGFRHGEVWTSTNQSNRVIHSLLKKRKFLQRGRIDGLDPGDPEIVFVKQKVPA